MKKKDSQKYIRIILITCLALCIFLILRFKIWVLSGTVVDTAANESYTENMFVIENGYNHYCDFSETPESINEKFHLNLKAEDPVFIICKGTNTEPAPKPIDIIFICKRW